MGRAGPYGLGLGVGELFGFYLTAVSVMAWGIEAPDCVLEYSILGKKIR